MFPVMYVQYQGLPVTDNPDRRLDNILDLFRRRPPSLDMAAPGAVNSRQAFLFNIAYTASPNRLIWPSIAALDFFSGAFFVALPEADLDTALGLSWSSGASGSLKYASAH